MKSVCPYLILNSIGSIFQIKRVKKHSTLRNNRKHVWKCNLRFVETKNTCENASYLGHIQKTRVKNAYYQGHI